MLFITVNRYVLSLSCIPLSPFFVFVFHIGITFPVRRYGHYIMIEFVDLTELYILYDVGDELLSDSFPYREIENGCLWEVDGKVS